MKIFDNTFAQAQTMLSLRGQRMEVLSRNIANADTPNFKAQDLDFKDVLKNAGSTTSIKATHQNHISNNAFKGSAEMVYTVPFNSSVDGNTVELSVEQAKYGKAAAQYQATLRFLEGEISGIRKALRGE
jgi:flagellar basal-body rod protein FlgB